MKVLLMKINEGSKEISKELKVVWHNVMLHLCWGDADNFKTLTTRLTGISD